MLCGGFLAATRVALAHPSGLFFAQGRALVRRLDADHVAIQQLDGGVGLLKFAHRAGVDLFDRAARLAIGPCLRVRQRAKPWQAQAASQHKLAQARGGALAWIWA